MISYKKILKVTEDDFNTRQEDVKTAIRKLVDEYTHNFLQRFPSTKVKFLISMKGEQLEHQYKFDFINNKEGINEVFAQLTINIEIVEPEYFVKEETHYKCF